MFCLGSLQAERITASQGHSRGKSASQVRLTKRNSEDIVTRPRKAARIGAEMASQVEWSAKRDSRRQPFGTWADDLASAFVQLEPHQTAELPFQGKITRTEVGPIRVSRVTATGHRVLRLRSHIAHSAGDLYFVNLQIEGLGRYTQCGHEQVCGTGDLALVDTNEPFEIANARHFCLFCFAVPRHLLPSGLSERPKLRLASTEMGRALSRTLLSYADLCFSSPTSSTIFPTSGAHIIELISHAPQVLEQQRAEAIGSPVLLSMMLEHVRNSFSDPDLSAKSLAFKFHCSERYVHKLFSLTGRPVGEHVNARRIQVCAQRLLNSETGKSVSEIAFTAGFRDISYFNRLFKREHGMAPREFRRSAGRKLD
jgi:AraC family transcriptional activator of tynA and feaB